MPTPPIVCLHSLTAHGVVGLKPFMSALGARCLPIPTAVLSGPGDMPGVARTSVDVARLLDASLAAILGRGTKAVVVIGYLANATQVSDLLEIVDRRRDLFEAVIVDPVSGDDGRAYVNDDLLAAWPQLIARANVAMPNLTEVELLMGERGETALAAWRKRFAGTATLVTGIPASGSIETRLYVGPGVHSLRTPRRPGRFNGTGDLFAALWTRAVYIHGVSPQAAALAAAEEVGRAIDAAIAAGSRDLPLPD